MLSAKSIINRVPVLEKGVIQTTCAYCGVGCGVDVSLNQGKPEVLTGNGEHPANHGRLCIKGTNLLDTIDTQDRLLYPQINGQQVSWQQATQTIASKFNALIEQHGPDSVALYLSGQLLTEDYYVANKWLKGYVGTANVDTNSRLCMSSAVAAYKRAFGEDVVPCDYTDLEQTDLLVLIGSNAAWTHPVLFQRMEKAKSVNPDLKVVVIDPRKTATNQLADLSLNIKAGSDAALFSGLLNYLNEKNQLDHSFIEQHTQGFDDALASAASWTVPTVAEFCDIPEQEVLNYFELFCHSPRVISFYSMGINQSSSGVDKCNAIINCHLASGKLLKPGCGPFSITGQPNAMGGREVGGLANMLAAHMDIENGNHRDTVQRFWQSPTMATKPGAKAVDMFDQILEGKIKAVWIMATNPMVSLPNREKIAKALEACELVIVSDCVSNTDTLKYADIKLPATGWAEKDGTVTNSERRISRQRALLPAAGEARHDWRIISEVATAMGYSGFGYQHQSEIFSEWAELTGFENQGKRQLDISDLAGMSVTEYNRMRPIQWPVNAQYPDGSKRVFAGNRFSTASGKANFIAITPKLPKQITSSEYPLVLNSGRLRDQWHTMTRTGRSAKLGRHIDKPLLMVHPEDALRFGLQQGALVQAKSTCGQAHFICQITTDVRKGETFAPIHWSQQFASSANVSSLYQSVVDPISGQPESKQAAITLAPVPTAQTIQLFSREEVKFSADFWVKGRSHHCLSWYLAFNEKLDELLDWCQQQSGFQGKWITRQDQQSQTVQILCLSDSGELLLAAFSSPKPLTLDMDWIDSLFETAPQFEEIRSILLAAPGEKFRQGRQICACHQVGEKTILDAIKQGEDTVEKLGKKLKCGTKCGSCKSELSQLIQSSQ